MLFKIRNRRFSTAVKGSIEPSPILSSRPRVEIELRLEHHGNPYRAAGSLVSSTGFGVL